MCVVYVHCAIHACGVCNDRVDIGSGDELLEQKYLCCNGFQR